MHMLKRKHQGGARVLLRMVFFVNLVVVSLLAACGGGGNEQTAPSVVNQPSGPPASTGTSPPADVVASQPPEQPDPGTPADPPAPAPLPADPPAPAPAPFSPTYVSDTVTYDNTGAGSLQKAQAVEQSATSQHEMMSNGERLTYVATAGHLHVVDAAANEEPRARMFYVAYTAKSDATNRPITFIYNGGPGSSSYWLHLGSFGPRRMDANAPNYYSEANADGTPPDIKFVENDESLLATTDLVFVDAMATGFSQAIEPKTNLDFWTTDEDAAAFRDFIIRYLEVNGRKSSPFYLMGESYGGPRTSILARLLAERGYMTDGIVLISPILNYNSNCSKDKSRAGSLYISCVGFIPSYVALTAHHKPEFLPAGKSVAEYIEQDVVPFTEQTYAPALANYMAALKKSSAAESGTPEKTAAEAELEVAKGPIEAARTEFKTRFGFDTYLSTGMPYNPKPVRVYEADGTLPGMELGRFDARIAVPETTYWSWSGDPSSGLLRPSYKATIASLLPMQLNFASSSAYAAGAGSDEDDAWKFTHSINGTPTTDTPLINEVDTIPDIQATLKLNPKMKILATSGYHDLATPFLQTKLDLDRLSGDERKNLTIKNYEGGHMIYVTNSSRLLMKADLEKFYRATAQ